MKKGFVLMETIVVIAVLCVVLVILYAAYSKLLIDVNKQSLYDKTEYLYKTNIVREHLEDVLNEMDYNSSSYYVYCRNALDDKKCFDDEVIGNYENELFKHLGVEAVYITLWNIADINDSDIASFEATTQNYMKTIDAVDDNAFRIIVMFDSENSTIDKVFEYATLRFGSRG